MYSGCECFKTGDDDSVQLPCQCPRPFEGNDEADAIFMKLIDTVANALITVLQICGIHECKAKGCKPVIIRAFKHYDEIRHRVDAVPRKRLTKSDLIHQFGCKCLMSHLEAQLSYSVLKRAFKAFYYGTCQGSCIRNPLLEAQLIHTQQCAWVHAAKRTAQIFSAYEGLFFAAERDYEARIRKVYRELYDQLKEDADALNLITIVPPDVPKRKPDADSEAWRKTKISIVTEDPNDDDDDVDDIKVFHKKPNTSVDTCNMVSGVCDLVGEMHGLHQNSTTERDAHPQVTVGLGKATCQCTTLASDSPRTIILANMDALMSAECSQGPFICRWLPLTDADVAEEATVAAMERAKFCLTLADDHECPIDCAPFGDNQAEYNDEYDDEDPSVCDEDYEDSDFNICSDDEQSIVVSGTTMDSDNFGEEATEMNDDDDDKCLMMKQLTKEFDEPDQFGNSHQLPTVKHMKSKYN